MFGRKASYARQVERCCSQYKAAYRKNNTEKDLGTRLVCAIPLGIFTNQLLPFSTTTKRFDDETFLRLKSDSSVCRKLFHINNCGILVKRYRTAV